jgi:hypothetical protein
MWDDAGPEKHSTVTITMLFPGVAGFLFEKKNYNAQNVTFHSSLFISEGDMNYNLLLYLRARFETHPA